MIKMKNVLCRMNCLLMVFLFQMAEQLPNIRVHAKEELSTFLSATDERKGPEPFTYTWRFEVKTMKQVGLEYSEVCFAWIYLDFF